MTRRSPASNQQQGLRHLELPVLSLERILASRKVAGRPKDLLAAHVIEDTLAVIEAEKPKDPT